MPEVVWREKSDFTASVYGLAKNDDPCIVEAMFLTYPATKAASKSLHSDARLSFDRTLWNQSRIKWRKEFYASKWRPERTRSTQYVLCYE